MKRNTTKKLEIKGFDPVIPCSWLPDGEIKLSEYEKVITHFVQNYKMTETQNAKPLCSKKSSD